MEKRCVSARRCGRIGEESKVRKMEIAIERSKDWSAQALARRMLARAASVTPEDVTFYRGDNEKPMTHLPLHFNCSHSGEYVVCAVSRRPIGIDLERIRPMGPQMERALSEGERRWLASRPASQRDGDILRLWTLKESWIKCRGGRLAEFRRAEFLLQGERLLSGPEGFSFRFWPAPDGYVLTVCEKE